MFATYIKCDVNFCFQCRSHEHQAAHRESEYEMLALQTVCADQLVTHYVCLSERNFPRMGSGDCKLVHLILSENDSFISKVSQPFYGHNAT
jgi:hypothetical protein